MLKPARTFGWIVLPLVFVAIMVGLFEGSRKFDSCIEEARAHSAGDQNASKEKPSVFIEEIRIYRRCTGRFVVYFNPAITAVSTLLLTIVTGLLVWVAAQQHRTTRAQLRAYVQPHVKGVVDFSLTDGIRISVAFKNAGQTPAYEFECHSAGFIAALPLPDNASFPKPKEDDATGRHSKGSIYPQTEYEIVVQVMDELNVGQIGAIRAGKAAIYVAGEGLYRDVSGSKRKSQYCLFIQQEHAMRLIRSAQNGTDDSFSVNFVWAHVLNAAT